VTFEDFTFANFGLESLPLDGWNEERWQYKQYKQDIKEHEQRMKKIEQDARKEAKSMVLYTSRVTLDFDTKSVQLIPIFEAAGSLANKVISTAEFCLATVEFDADLCLIWYLFGLTVFVEFAILAFASWGFLSYSIAAGRKGSIYHDNSLKDLAKAVAWFLGIIVALWAFIWCCMIHHNLTLYLWSILS
jgi:hypothetical protein